MSWVRPISFTVSKAADSDVGRFHFLQLTLALGNIRLAVLSKTLPILRAAMGHNKYILLLLVLCLVSACETNSEGAKTAQVQEVDAVNRRGLGDKVVPAFVADPSDLGAKGPAVLLANEVTVESAGFLTDELRPKKGLSKRGRLEQVKPKSRSGGSPGIGSGHPTGADNDSVARIILGDPAIQGKLDKEIIRRVARRHRGELQHCYKKGLNMEPNLAGGVVVRFTITKSGSVGSAAARKSTLNSKLVEQCLLQKTQRWAFPKPRDGGLVVVTYPFKFSYSDKVPDEQRDLTAVELGGKEF